MTVRFKSEYQKNFGSSHSGKTMSAQCCPPLAGLRSDHMGHDREPHLQRRRRLCPVGPVRSCSPLLQPPPPPAVSRKQPDPEPPTPPGSPADPETTQRPEEAAEAKPRPSRPHSQSQPRRPVTSEAPIEMNSELRARGQRSGGQRSESHRQFNLKTPAAAASPILTAQQVFHSNSRSVPPFKKNPLPQETEYQRSFQGLAPPTGPRLWKHLEHQRTPLFQLQRKRREESQKKPRPKPNPRQQEDGRSPPKATPPPSPPPQVHRRHRMSTEYQSSFRSPIYRIPEGGGATEGDAHQMTELRQQAQWYRRRAWGTNFSRDHLSQLLSEHTALWEPVDSPTDPPTPRAARSPQSHTPSCVDALDLASNSSQRLSVANSGGHKKTSPAPPAERRSAWGERGGRGEEEEDTEEDEGRLPTPRLKMKPVQRTHHDLTTPATGGAMLVGKLKTAGDSSPCRQRCESSVSMVAGAEPALWTPVKQKEAWPEKVSASPSLPSPNHKPASKPNRVKPTPPPTEAPPPQHGLHGTLRHADFQHNGDMGLKLKEAPCSGGCCSDEDERLSVMSWRSAAACSAASVVLDRALKRRDDFWGKT